MKRPYSHTHTFTHKSWHKAKTRRIEMTESELWLFYANNIITIHFRVLYGTCVCENVPILKKTLFLYIFLKALHRRTKRQETKNVCVLKIELFPVFLYFHFQTYDCMYLYTWLYKNTLKTSITRQCYNNLDVVGERWLKLLYGNVCRGGMRVCVMDPHHTLFFFFSGNWYSDVWSEWENNCKK